jgi:hypothetical protein
MHEPTTSYGELPSAYPEVPVPPAPPSGPGPFARLVALVITAGLAWAIVVALGAWLIGLLIARG